MKSAQDTWSLAGVSLSISQGEYVAVAGVNGSGKSTLLRHVNGLLLPVRGRVTSFGFDTSDRQALRDIRMRASMVFQDPDAQIVGSTVEEDVAFGPENLGLPVAELRERVAWALETVGLIKLRSRSSHMLSAGQKQLLAVAGALAMRPWCLLFDEAGTMLDPLSRERLTGLIGELNRQGVTVIRATHRMEEAAEAERVIVMKSGKIAADLSPRHLFRDEKRVRDLGLDLPRSVELGNHVRTLVSDFPEVCLNMEELVEAVSARAGGRL
jgi:energy-coupling factor transport system ATP-binding protein